MGEHIRISVEGLPRDPGRLSLLGRLARKFGYRAEGYPPTVDQMLGHDNNYGFRVFSGPESACVTPITDGAPIVGAARALRARKEGRIPLSSGVTHPEAKELLRMVDASRATTETQDSDQTE